MKTRMYWKNIVIGILSLALVLSLGACTLVESVRSRIIPDRETTEEAEADARPEGQVFSDGLEMSLDKVVAEIEKQESEGDGALISWDDLDKRLEEVVALIEDGKYDPAMEKLNTIIKKYPDYADLYSFKAKLCLDMDDLICALDAANMLIAYGNNEGYYLRGKAYYYLDLNGKAAEDMLVYGESVIEKGDEDIYLALAYLDNGDYEQALEMLETLNTAYMVDMNGNIDKLEALVGLERWEEANLFMESMDLNLDENDTQGLGELASLMCKVYYELEDWDMVEEICMGALALVNDMESGLLLFDRFYQVKEYDLAIYGYDLIFESVSFESEVYFHRGRAYLAKGDKTRAYADFRTVLERDDSEEMTAAVLELAPELGE